MHLITELALLGVVEGCINAILAMAFGFMLRTTRIFHVAYGGVYIASAYVYYYSIVSWKLPAAVAVLLVCAAAIGMNLLIYWAVYWPCLRRGTRIFLTGFVASLGVLTIIDNALGFVNTGGFLSFPDGVLTTTRVTFGGYYLQTGDLVGVFLAILSLVALTTFLRKSRYGFSLRALASDRALAEEYGMNVKLFDSTAYVIGGLLLVPVAIIVPSLQGLSASSGLDVATVAFTAAIVGGVSNTVGTFAAAIILTVLESLSVRWLPGAWEDTIGLAIMAVVLLIRPGGIFASGSSTSFMAGRSA